MSTVTTFAKVVSYNSSTGKLVCQWLPPAFTWKEGRVRTSGSHASQCNVDTREFDVTILPATAAQLVPDFMFPIVYDNSGAGPVKTVTKFAGQAIPPALAAATSPTSPAPADATSSPPAE